MCGLAGVVSLHGRNPIDEKILDTMTVSLAHRGPDATGRFLSDGVGIGFRRLSIIDLAGGNQPMFSEDGNVTLVCNGEIFNHKELRSDLVAKGHTFRTRCDVEVLVHLYEEEGMGLLSKVNGQFAFATYDQRRKQLFLARDHMGIVPMYYTRTAGHLVFGSEIKSILSHPDVRPEVDMTGLDQVLTFPGLVSPRTMFRGIHSLEQGQYLSLRDGEMELVRYWDLDFPPEGEDCGRESDDYYVESLRELLSQSVRYRLQANVPVGLYLSGGLDSSLIGALANEAAPRSPRPHSFSIAFPGSAIDESPYQRLMADAISSRHHESPCDAAHITDNLQRMVYHAECPVKEVYNTCSLRLSEMAGATGNKVILTGEGADELFAGYPGYRFDHASSGRSSRRNRLDAALEEEMSRKLWGDTRIFYERDYHAWSETKTEMYSDGVVEDFATFDCTNFPLVDQRRIAGRHPVHQRSYLDFRLRLSDHLLSDHGDRMALANSVEARYPFLDREVVEFATKIPPRLKVNEQGEKYVLKRIARGLVPPPIIEREKFGFRAPGSPALLRQHVEWINDILSFERIKRQGYFNPLAVERLKSSGLRPDADINPHLTDDLLLVVLTFGILLDAFNLPAYS
ncbi:asparagine synthase (glutamine-hydrolyzing) [Streptomyces sp. NPDC050287]|uniref:asparagine synthase (glutamine-hydrolyzing) n=1 Tax=Streptomyces sp. NPDC050287 TaxID=3365608 RepID=UPI0037A231C5